MACRSTPKIADDFSGVKIQISSEVVVFFFLMFYYFSIEPVIHELIVNHSA